MRKAFVSSTFADLKMIREEVRNALRRIDYLDVAMEYLSAEDARPLDRCTALVRDSDVYLGIFAWRYGFVPETSQLSITELEYKEARASGKPCILLLLSEDAPWPAKLIDTDRRAIERLRARLCQSHIVSFFNGRDDIVARLYEALRTFEQSTCERGALAELPKEFDMAAHKIVEVQQDLHGSFRLFDLQQDIRIDEVYVQELLDTKVHNGPLAQLQQAHDRPKSDPMVDGTILDKIRTREIDCRVCIFEGRAGAGKSTMLKMWLLILVRRWQEGLPDAVLPVFVALRDFEETPGGMSWLEETLCRSTPGLRRSIAHTVLNPQSPAAALRNPKVLLLADGFDEMPAESRKRFLTLLTALPPSFRCALTTRPGILAETGYPRGSRTFELCDFNQQQIGEYLKRWFASTPELGTQLVDRIQANARLRELASIPLLLACLALHVQLNGTFCLSDELVERELIRASVEILVERWDAWKDGRTPDAGFIHRACMVFKGLTRHPRYKTVCWDDLVALEPILNLDDPFATAFHERVLKNGRVLNGSAKDGIRFSHAIFYDFFFAERLAEAVTG